MMQDHLDRTRTETLAIRTQVDKAKRLLEGLGSLGLSDSAAAAAVATSGAGSTQLTEEKRRAEDAKDSNIDWNRERQIWASVDDIFP